MRRPPDRRGFITGIAVAGFGAGALITAPIAERLIESVGLFETFAILGAIYLVVVTGAAATLSNPPEDWKPEGWEPETETRENRSGVDYDVSGALRTWQWWALWGLLFLNVTAGTSLISEASPIAQEVTGATAATAAGLVSIISIAKRRRAVPCEPGCRT